MKISMHPLVKGKPTDMAVNLGYGWENIDADWPDIFELITTDGYATSAYLKSDHRIHPNFVSRELVMVDIDNGMTIPELFNNPFYEEYGAGFYATPSFKPDHHKFRILFRTETPITDGNIFRKLSRAMLIVFEQADPACIDPARLYYGAINCEIKEIRDNILPDVIVLELCKMIDSIDDKKSKSYEMPVEYKALSNNKKKCIIDLLHGTFIGEYQKWRDIGWGLKAGGFTLQDYQYATTGMMRQKSATDAEKVWNSGKSDGDISMGTVIYWLKQYHGEDKVHECFRESSNWRDVRGELYKKYAASI